PDSDFVGIDLSAKAIARGEDLRVRLGLDNLQLVADDLMAWQPDGRPFDFIVAHGFYSWVPAPVRDCLLRLCGTWLAPAGLACVSYNTLPGGHLRRMLWDIMRYQADGAADPDERIARALECVDLLESGMPEGRHYTTVMREEIRWLRDRLDPSVLFHDDLAEINDPCFFDAFLRHARTHGLDFVAEASYHEMSPRNAAPEVRDMLAGIAVDDLATKEQYLDFFTGRRFRQTLLGRAGAGMHGQADSQALADLEVVSPMHLEPDAPASAEGVSFRHPTNGSLRTPDPLIQAALAHAAARYPGACRVSTLGGIAAASASLATPDAGEVDRLHRFLLRAFEVGLLELHLDAPVFASEPDTMPVASPLARLMLAGQHGLIPNLRPRLVRLPDALVGELLLLLDGTRDRAALQALANDGIATGRLPPPQNGDVTEVVDACIVEFARLALIVAK
ncbi:MAG: hypothetical protein EOP93_13175, partial [Lysobacteraceae bacterium]